MELVTNFTQVGDVSKTLTPQKVLNNVDKTKYTKDKEKFTLSMTNTMSGFYLFTFWVLFFSESAT